jgi:hypothetical protein
MNFSSKSTNKELLLDPTFKAALETGKPVVYFVGEPKKGKDTKTYLSLHIAQLKKVGEVDPIMQMFLGWDNTLLVRAWQNIEATQLAKPEVAKVAKAGSIMEGFTLVTIDSLVPTSTEQKPRQTKVVDDNGVEETMIYTLDGSPIYRTMKLSLEALKEDDHIIKHNGTVNLKEVSMPFSSMAMMPE